MNIGEIAEGEGFFDILHCLRPHVNLGVQDLNMI